jgi:hypothetical protein
MNRTPNLLWRFNGNGDFPRVRSGYRHRRGRQVTGYAKHSCYPLCLLMAQRLLPLGCWLFRANDLWAQRAKSPNSNNDANVTPASPFVKVLARLGDWCRYGLLAIDLRCGRVRRSSCVCLEKLEPFLGRYATNTRRHHPLDILIHYAVSRQTTKILTGIVNRFV